MSEKYRMIMALSISDLSKKGRELLGAGFMKENLRDMWFSKEAVLDALYNGGFGPFEEGWYDEIPEDFWTTLGLSKKTLAAVREHVESGGEVIFEE